MQRYDSEIEGEMRAFFESLKEKDRRRYAAIEARKLGHGGAVTWRVSLVVNVV